MADEDEMSLISSPPSESQAVQSGNMTEEEYLDATCDAATQSCALSHREQRAINRNCLYQLFEVYRIKKDGTSKLIYTFQAQSRNPGTMAFYSVSGYTGTNGQAQLKCKVTSVTGPCHNHNNQRNWQYNRSLITTQQIRTKTTTEFTFYAKADEVEFLDSFWMPSIRPKTYYVQSNFCGGAGRSVSFNVYPDINWEIKLKGSWSDSEGREHDADEELNAFMQREIRPARVAGLEFSVKRTIGCDEEVFTENYRRIVDNFNAIVSVIKRIVQFLESKKKPATASASNRRTARGMTTADRQMVAGNSDATDGQVAQGIAEQRQLSEGFEIEWPEVDVTFKWGWEESDQFIYGKKAEYKWDISGNIKFFKVSFTIELLGPLLSTIPGAGPFLSKLRDLGEDTGLLTLSVKASGSAEVTANITWKQTYNQSDSRELSVGGALKLEITVQATLSTKVTSGGVFGYQAEFGAGLQGSATTGITFSIENNLWKADGSDLKGAFKINFDGVTIRGIVYVEYGLTHSENEDGRDNRRSSNVDDTTRQLNNSSRPASDQLASRDQSDAVGNTNSGTSHRRARQYTHMLFEADELCKYEVKFN